MASKKYTLLAGLFCLLVSSAFSQAQVRSYEDSSVIPTKRMPQHTEFLNGTYNFPAKPRNQWELGIKGGLSAVSGDVRSKMPTFGGGIHIRKAFGYVFSMRLEYDYLTAKGLNFSGSQGYVRNNVLQPIYAPNPGVAVPIIFYNYKTTISELGLHGVVTLNNIRFHKSKTGINFYGFGGIAGMVYNTMYNALNASGQPYDYSSIAAMTQTYATRKDIRKALKNLLDNSYETKAERDPLQPKLGGNPFKPAFVAGAGVQFKLSTRFNLAIEDKFTSVKTDLLDGQQWQENYGNGNTGAVAQTRDYDSYNFLSVGLNVNLGSKSVEPLWWLNPLDYAYSEIRKPKLMIMPKVILPDADGDGVTDQFDLEQTPPGCPVDTHGVSLDTDGDGVPDCKDKEKITPTICQPVDADGVGKCPCPDSSCITPYLKNLVANNGCDTKLGALPSITFTGKSVTLSKDAQALCATVGSRMRNNPECKVVIIGYCNSTKQEQQLSWDRVNAVENYLVEKEGISNDRFIFQYGQEGGDCNTVDLRGAATGEEGPNTVPAPHPNLRRTK